VARGVTYIYFYENENNITMTQIANDNDFVTTCFREQNRPQVSRTGFHTRRIVRVEFRKPLRRPCVGQQRGIGRGHVELQARHIG